MNQAFLDPPQQELLVQLVETERSVAIEDRGKWIVSQALSRRDQFLYGGKKHVVITGAVQDVEVLASVGLVAISYTPRGTMNFFVMPSGFRYYENLMHSDSPAESTVDHMKQHLSTYDFKSAYAAAFDRWSRAELLLWSSESQQQLTTIGHLCREAMQEFADSLVTRFNLGDSYPDKTKIVARVRAVLDLRRESAGGTLHALLIALLTYWGTVSDLAQRQEHGAQQESEALLWEDARRLVFQTCVVMYEIDRALALG